MSLNSCELFSISTELVELKIEEFLTSFGKKLNSLTEEAFNTQVRVCVYVSVFCVCMSFHLFCKIRKVTGNAVWKSFKNVKLLFNLLWWINNTFPNHERPRRTFRASAAL